MPTPATDRQRITLVVVALVSVGLAALSFKALDAAAVTAEKPVPAGDLRRLASYLAPLPDMSSLDLPANGTMVGQADPFGAAAPAKDPSTNNAVSKPEPGHKWVVSSILFEDSKRSAIIDGAWANVGDLLADGARLTAIERKYVVVTDARGNRSVVPIQGARHEN